MRSQWGAWNEAMDSRGERNQKKVKKYKSRWSHKKSSLIFLLAPISWRLLSKFLTTCLYLPKFFKNFQKFTQGTGFFFIHENLEALVPYWFYDLTAVKIPAFSFSIADSGNLVQIYLQQSPFVSWYSALIWTGSENIWDISKKGWVWLFFTPDALFCLNNQSFLSNVWM